MLLTVALVGVSAATVAGVYWLVWAVLLNCPKNCIDNSGGYDIIQVTKKADASEAGVTV